VSKRKQHGVVYTPDHITHLIVEQTLGAHLRAKFAALWDASADKRKKDGTWLKKGEPELQFWRDYQQVLRTVRVVDPACGSGAFLVAAFEYLYDEYRRVNDKLADLAGGSYDMFDLDKEILNRNLYGVDVNTESIEITKLSLWLKTAKVGKVLNSLDDNIQVGNSLINDPIYTDKPFDWAQFSANAHAKNQDLFTAPVDDKGFDVVLGNPPYVRMEYLKPIKPYLEKNYQVAADRADLYAYFFELGFNILKPGGRMGYISSSTFFKTGSGENLRRFLMENVSLENILDFGDLQIFEGVTTYPVILTLCKAVPQAEHTFKMLILKQQVSADLNKYFLKYASVMPQADLELGAWRLEDKIMLALRQKITANKPTLKAVYGSPLYGIKTGLNEAFIIDRATRDALIKEDAKSEELLKPFLDGRDLFRWYLEYKDAFIIYIPKNKIDITQYPAIESFLLS
jgi:hypothetical protein